MCPRRDNANSASASKQCERDTRRQEKKAREKKAYVKNDENSAAFDKQLRTFNLQLRDIAGDGNCLFRSFADQMDGSQQRHGFYREQICDFMRKNREDFEPFIVDQPFDAFMRSLANDGTYGGNESIVAFSRLYDARICIHQLNQPVWTVCFSDPPKHEIHISYHNYEHYSSVRKVGDNTSASANIRQPMTTCDPSSISKKPVKENKDQGACAAATTWENESIEHDIDYIASQLVIPMDRQIIRDALTDHHNDVDGTVVYLLALNLPSTPSVDPDLEQSLERIMSITNIFDVELVRQLLVEHQHDIDATVRTLLSLNASNGDDKETEDISEEPDTDKTSKGKGRPVPNRQVKVDKKKAKKQRATEKHRAEIAATASDKPPTKATEERADVPVANGQEPVQLANMEFIRI